MTETNHSQTIPISPNVFPTKNKKMTEKNKNQMVPLCCDCKHYKDYEDALDWIISRIMGCPTLQKCYHPDRRKDVDYVNGTTDPYGLCSIERLTGNCKKEGNNWEAK